MSWIGLHTSPNVDPHCTLAWWPAKGEKKAKALYVAKKLAAIDEPVDVWVDHLAEFGAGGEIEVALLRNTPELQRMLTLAAPLHSSSHPQRPHVTAHEGRQFFHFQWIGLHHQREHRYFQLGNEKR